MHSYMEDKEHICPEIISTKDYKSEDENIYRHAITFTFDIICLCLVK